MNKTAQQDLGDSRQLRRVTVGPRRRLPARNLIFGVAAIVGFLLLMPLGWLLIQSVTPEGLIGASPLRLFPESPTLENYQHALTYIDYSRYFLNSVILAVVYTLPTVISSAVSGYAFASWRAPGSKFLFALVIGILLIPLFVFVLPLFVIYSRLGLLNTLWPWILWGLAGSPFLIFLFRQFFDSIPRELAEAAELDGCGRVTTFWRVILPNARGIIATASILTFTSVWGEVLIQSLFLNDDDHTTLSVRLADGYVNAASNTPEVGPLLAGVVMYVLPVVMIFLVAQRQILNVAATSGLK